MSVKPSRKHSLDCNHPVLSFLWQVSSRSSGSSSHRAPRATSRGDCTSRYSLCVSLCTPYPFSRRVKQIGARQRNLHWPVASLFSLFPHEKAGNASIFFRTYCDPCGLFPVRTGQENAFHCWQILALAFKQIFYIRFSLNLLVNLFPYLGQWSSDFSPSW